MKTIKTEFEKAWYLAYANREFGVSQPNFNSLFNSEIEKIAGIIPVKYWEQAKGMSSNEAFQVYNSSK